jgi:hypothetical protein
MTVRRATTLIHTHTHTHTHTHIYIYGQRLTGTDACQSLHPPAHQRAAAKALASQNSAGCVLQAHTAAADALPDNLSIQGYCAHLQDGQGHENGNSNTAYYFASRAARGDWEQRKRVKEYRGDWEQRKRVKEYYFASRAGLGDGRERKRVKDGAVRLLTERKTQVLSSITALKKLCNHPKLIHDAIRAQQAGFFPARSLPAGARLRPSRSCLRVAFARRVHGRVVRVSTGSRKFN